MRLRASALGFARVSRATLAQGSLTVFDQFYKALGTEGVIDKLDALVEPRSSRTMEKHTAEK